MARDAGERVADGPVQHGLGLADGGGQALEGVGAVGVVEDRGGLLAGRGGAAPEAMPVQDGAGVGEHERDVAGDARVEAGQGRLLAAAGVVDQRHAGVPFSFAPAGGFRGGGRWRAVVARSR